MKNYELARLFLSGGTLQGITPRKLADTLRHEEKYSYSAELYLKILETCKSVTERKEILKHLAFCFYKDPDLPSSTKFDKAIQYLYEIDDSESFDCEIFGKLGAAFKYRWYSDNRFESLLHARYFYQKGYEYWYKKYLSQLAQDDTSSDVEIKCHHLLEDTDTGYNAINYAFVLDLMSFVRSNVMSNLHDAEGESVNKWRDKAKKVRKEIIDYIPKLNQAIEDYNRKQKDPDKIRRLESWINPTLGEAHFGLGEYEMAEAYYKAYSTGSPNKKDPSKIDKPRAWEIKTTVRQMLAFAEFFIAQKKQDLVHAKKEEDRKEINDAIDKCETASRACYAALYECKTSDLPENTTKGKVGLGLSGGGHRAALFHIGVLAALAERDVLRHVEVLSCVSGGSIAGAYYYLLLKNLLEKKPDARPTKDGETNPETLQPLDYIELVQEMERKFLGAVQGNLRMSILKEFWPNFKIFLDKKYSRTVRAAELYESDYYQEIANEGVSRGEDPMLMSNLKIRPKGTEQDFKPKEQNWQRHFKVPTLVLNATSLNTGHNWQFTASWMGEPPANIRPDIDSKPRLRRMYYDEAPEPYDETRLGTAVGASSCVPALFTPVHFPDLYENQDLHLVDGGVHDNQGIASLLEQECKIMIISDASGQLSSEKISSDDMLGSFWRSDSILQARVRESQFLDLRERYASGQISSLSIVHLTKDLQANPIKWKYCEDPTRQQWLAAHDGDNISRTTYGILQTVQAALAEIRTDLDAFNDAEAYALMYSGYQQMHHDFDARKLGDIFSEPQDPTVAKPVDDEAAKERWKFMEIKPYMTVPEKSRWLLPRLELGKKQVFRSVQIITWLRITVSLFVILLVIGLVAGLWYYRERTLLVLSVSTLGVLVILKVLGHLGGPLVSKLLSWKTIVIEVASAFLLALAVKFYLWCIAPHYLRYGSLSELEKEGSFEPIKRWYRRWV
ncbi:MAG: patatin-like phospholipase family protein [Saprospiraceae bacterium]